MAAMTCAHPGCGCAPKHGDKYCSLYCHDAGDQTEIQCDCGHMDCHQEKAALVTE